MVSGTEDIEQSLTILMQTAVGQRPFQPDFHCDLQAYIFQHNNYQLLENIRQTVQQAIMINEPRIELEQTDIEADPQQPEQLLITVNYRIRQTNTRHNKTYPFCLAEGTNFALLQDETAHELPYDPRMQSFAEPTRGTE